MKKIFISFYFIVIISSLNAQEYFLNNLTTDFLWYGLENIIKINDNIKKSNLLIKSKDSSIKWLNDSIFSVVPKHFGETKLFVYKTINNDTIKVTEKSFRIKRFPQATAYLGTSFMQDSISKMGICSMSGINVSVFNFDIDVNYEPISYDVMIIRKDKVILSKNYSGKKFTNELKEELEKLEQGDKLFFYNIKSKDNMGIIHKEGQINLIVK